MSYNDNDDDPFDDLEFDESTLAQLDALQSAASAPKKVLVPQTPPSPPANHSAQLRTKAGPSNPLRNTATHSDPIDIDSDDIWQDDAVLGQLDRLERQAPAQTSSSRQPAHPASNPLRQRNLYGQTVQDHGALLLSTQNVPGARIAKKTKQWDRTAYAQSGAKRLTAPRKSAAFTTSSSDWTHEDIDLDDDDDDDEEGCATNAPLAGSSAVLQPARTPLPPDSMKLQLDLEAARKITYPVNMAKRDYQFNIVQRALFDNVLVALPTGLGKTFIAAVVILNFFKWYPKGKIVFVAPTKPLVAQQQTACHGICGLPWDVACEMTGTTAKSRRGDEWDQKRIFYMTPQTLDNDIRTGDVDPRDIICLVVDEAHRATGNYAYCQIVAQMQAVNPHFRILALTATPGSTAERVQEVIDSLHISLIELRTEEALDIRQYIHKKHEETIIVPLTDDFRYVRELYLELLQTNCETLVKNGLLPNADPNTLHPFRVRSIFRERGDVLAKKRWLSATINETAKMAEARQHLDIFSIKMFRSRAQEILDSYKKQENKKMKLAQVLNLAASIPDQIHPKMASTIEIISEHLQKEADAGNPNSKVMVFCSLRECVHEIVELLNRTEGLRATVFIGQAADRQGRGLRQKEQQEIIAKYKQGIFNVIVATSIGEEGLDIGEVDLIICYEAVKDSVRMLQRVGRTGRKRDGRIVVLMAEGPESLVWQRSKDTYKGVQQTITAGHSVTLFDDVPRLVPPSIKPVVSFEELDQPEFQPEMIGNRKGKAAKSAKTAERAKKRKERHADASKNVPEGALLGFLRASSLKRRKVGSDSLREGDDESSATSEPAGAGPSSLRPSESLLDDSDDEDVERGLLFGGQGLPTANESAENRHQLGKASVKGGTSVNAHVSTRRQTATTPNSAPGKRLGARPTLRTPLAVESSEGDPIASPKEARGRSPPAQVVLSSSPPPSSPPLVPSLHGPSSPVNASDDEFDTSWSVDASAFVDLTQRAVKQRSPLPSEQLGEACEPSSRGQPHPLIAQLAAQERQKVKKSSVRAHDDAAAARLPGSPSPGMHDTDQAPAPSLSQESPMPARVGRRVLKGVNGSSPAVCGRGDATMGPPAVPLRRFRRGVLPSTPDDTDEQHRRPVSGKMAKPLKAAAATAGPTTPQPKQKRRKKKKIIGRSPTSKALFHLEADRDSDEGGRRRRRRRQADSDDEGISTDEADSSDREHVGDFEPTQAPKGYNQMSIYHQSLLTQAAPSPFRRKTVGGFVGGRYGIQEHGAAAQRAAQLSSPRLGGGDDDEEDRYSLGSFVCEDDEEIMYASDGEDELGEDD